MKTLFAIVPFGLGLLMTESNTGLAAQDLLAPASRATISNRLPRRDTDGTIVDAQVKYRLNGQPASFTGTDPETVDLLEQE